MQIALFMTISNVVDFTDPTVLMATRVLYGIVALFFYKAQSSLEAAVRERADTRQIWVKKAAAKGLMDSLFGSSEPAAAPEYTQTTVMDHELALVQKKIESGVMGFAQPFILSMLMGVHVLLAVNVIMMPVNQYEDPLMKRHYFKAVYDDGAHGEVYEDPNAKPDAVTAGADAGAVGSTSRPSAAADVEMEEAVLSTWESVSDPAPLPVFESLVAKGKDINYRAGSGAWSALHVVAGGAQNGKREVSRLLELGSKPELTDSEGWTCLHWAAHHDTAFAVEAVTAAYMGRGKTLKGSAAAGEVAASGSASDDKKGAIGTLGGAAGLRSLLAMTDAKGRTAFQVAEAEGSEASAAALKAAVDAAGPEPAPLLQASAGKVVSSSSSSTGSDSKAHAE